MPSLYAAESSMSETAEITMLQRASCSSHVFMQMDLTDPAQSSYAKIHHLLTRGAHVLSVQLPPHPRVTDFTALAYLRCFSSFPSEGDCISHSRKM